MPPITKLLFITDSTTHRDGDTTPALYRALALREDVEFFHLANFLLQDSDDELLVSPVSGALTFSDFEGLNERATRNATFEDFDLVMDRSDAPLPNGHYDALTKHEKKVKFIGRPSSLHMARRKSFLSAIPSVQKYMPQQVFTNSIEEAEQFFRLYGEAVLKQDLSFGGRGVFRFQEDTSGLLLVSGAAGMQRTFSSFAEAVCAIFPEHSEGFQCVEFLRNVYKGDKRVLVVGGEIYGSFLRKASSGSWVQNIGSGGTRAHADVSAHEQEVVQSVVPFYQEIGLEILGFDFLLGNDDHTWVLSEVNCGNVSGFSGYEALTGIPTISRLVDWIVSRA